MVETKRFKLFGFPLSYSLSPLIHKLFAQQCGIDILYDLQIVHPRDLSVALQHFIETGGKGLNITAPLKEQSYKILKKFHPNAKYAQAVNTVIINDDNSVCGANTDGIGFLRDLQRHAIPIAKQKIIILGAGGAVRGILQPILNLNPQAVYLINRDLIKARAVANEFAQFGNVTVAAYSELYAIKADVIIHACSVDASSKEPPKYSALKFTNTYCYDLNYSVDADFLKIAQLHGAKKCVNGLGMLVEQAAASFDLWHGLQPNVDRVLEYLQQNTDQKSANYAV